MITSTTTTNNGALAFNNWPKALKAAMTNKLKEFPEWNSTSANASMSGDGQLYFEISSTSSTSYVCYDITSTTEVSLNDFIPDIQFYKDSTSENNPLHYRKITYNKTLETHSGLQAISSVKTSTATYAIIDCDKLMYYDRNAESFKPVALENGVFKMISDLDSIYYSPAYEFTKPVFFVKSSSSCYTCTTNQPEHVFFFKTNYVKDSVTYYGTLCFSDVYNTTTQDNPYFIIQRPDSSTTSDPIATLEVI